MILLKQFIFSFLASFSFAVFFRAPKKSLFATGITGAIGWVVYFLFGTTVTSAFLGALTVGILGETFARAHKKPATIYITPGIIPLVPGAGTYYTMLSLLKNDYTLFAKYAVETFFTAAAIAIGVIFSSIFSMSIKQFKRKS